MAKRWGKSEKQRVYQSAGFESRRKPPPKPKSWGDQELKHMNKSYSLQEVGKKQQKSQGGAGGRRTRRPASQQQANRRPSRTVFGDLPDAWDRPRTGVTMSNSISREQASKVCNSLMKDVPTQKMLSANDNTVVYDTTKCYDYLHGSNKNGAIGLKSKVTRSKALRVANSILKDVPMKRSTMGPKPEDEHFGDDLFEKSNASLADNSLATTGLNSSVASNFSLRSKGSSTYSPFEVGALAYDVDRGERYLQRNRNSASMRSQVSREKSSEIANSVLKDIPMKRASSRPFCQQKGEYDVDRCDRYLKGEKASGGCYTMRSTVSRNDATSVANSILKDVPMKMAEKAFIIDSMGGMTPIILAHLDAN